MPLSDPDLWAEILRLPLPGSDGPVPFAPGRPKDRAFADLVARRLELYPANAANAVAEYRRFLYLSRLSGETLCPSRIIAEVQALHSQAASDTGFAPNAPQTGWTEDESSLARTLSLYRREFDMDAPEAYWPTARTVARTRRAWRIFGVGVLLSLAAGALSGMLFHQIDPEAYRFNWAVLLIGLALAAGAGLRVPHVVRTGEASAG